MSFTGLLNHKCDIYRRATGEDRFGQPKGAAADFSKIERVACRISFAGFSGAQYRPGEVMSERYEDLVREPRIVFIPAGTDVREADRIKVYESDGATEVLPLTEITSVRRRFGAGNDENHIELLVETYRSGAEKVVN